MVPGPPAAQQAFTLPIPNDRRLLGTKFYVQALNRFGSGDPYSQIPKPAERWRSTEALELTIGT